MSASARHVRIVIDGVETTAPEGAPLAAVLDLHRALRRSPRAGGARNLFCGIGSCFECLVVIDGAPRRACLVRVRDGLTVETAP